MIFSSWTYDQTGIDYFPASDEISIANYLENEGWEILTTKGGSEYYCKLCEDLSLQDLVLTISFP